MLLSVKLYVPVALRAVVPVADSFQLDHGAVEVSKFVLLIIVASSAVVYKS